VNVTLRLVSLCPPAFPPIHFAPHPNRPQVFLRPKANRKQSNLRIPMLSPLCFHGLTNCFSRKPFLFKNICVAPRVCPQNRFSEGNYVDLPTAPTYPLHYQSIAHSCSLLQLFSALPPFVFSSLQTLCAKTGGVGVPSASEPMRNSASVPLCVLCGASAFPALSFPSFGGPKNADAR